MHGGPEPALYAGEGFADRGGNASREQSPWGLIFIARVLILAEISLDFACPRGYIPYRLYRMAWEVEYTDEFEHWWNGLDEAEQESVAASVGLLEQVGPDLRHPHSSGIEKSRHGHMRELRVQHRGRPYRVIYAFDPRRTAILLIGGDKTGDNRWYEKFVPFADKLYDEHIATLRKEGLIDG
jgi:hypothetical protein